MHHWTYCLILVFLYVFILRELSMKTAPRAGDWNRGEMTLLPVMNPLFNVREMSIQCILLEMHLNSPQRRCNDCIRKHFLAIEGLADEAIGLDKTGEHRDFLLPIPNEIRRLQDAWVAKEPACDIAQELRRMRKPWTVKTFALQDRPLFVQPGPF